MSTSFPSNRIVPESTARFPDNAFTNVDFPAPLSPINAVTSPGNTSKSTSFNART